MEHCPAVRHLIEKGVMVGIDVAVPGRIHQAVTVDTGFKGMGRLDILELRYMDMGLPAFDLCRVADIREAVPKDECLVVQVIKVDSV